MPRQATHFFIWILILNVALPPALLAQAVGGGGSLPIPYGALSSQAPLQQSGQPIMTNPDALKPTTPSSLPCPAQGSGGAPAPTVTQDPSATTERLSALGIAPSSQPPLRPIAGQGGMQPSSGVSSIPGSTQSSKGGGTQTLGTAGGQSGAVGLPGNPGLLSPMVSSQVGSQGSMASGLPGQFQVDPGSALTIEESFSRFFLLQGMTGQLKQFGYNFFDIGFPGIHPVMDVPVGPDYVLGPEDTLSIHIWNVPESSLNRSYISPVERDGTIFIPQVGSIPVAGSTFAQVNQILHAKLSTLLKRFDLHVSMARLRTMKVFVVGEVNRPGAYEVSSLATASHSLYAACGPAKSGSLRRIQVVRGNKTVAELDFYEFLLRGDRSHDLRLQSGDTIVVPPIGAVAAVGGPVRRPAIFEMKERTTLGDLLELAGGLQPSADRSHAQIFRLEAGKKRVILDLPLGSALNGGRKFDESQATPLITDGDFVRIASIPIQIENAVTLAGAVRAPGPYEFKPGMRLLDLVTPEQVLVDSYLDKAELVRTDPFTYETTVIPINIKELLQGKQDNLELHRLDKVVVATQVRQSRSVSIAGEIKRPGSYAIESGERLSSVLKRSGGVTSRAYPSGLVFIRDSVKRIQAVEVEKFVAAQKQRLISEAASYSAGAAPTPGVNQQGAEVSTLQIQLQALDQLANRLPLGRIVLKVDSVETLESTDADIVLEEGDQITIPIRPSVVNIIGAVRNPTTVLHREDFDLDDYLRQAGGFLPTAAEKEVYLVRANGSADAGYARARDISVGDTIVVPEHIEPKTRTLPLWQSIASIIGSAALAVAAIAVIGHL
jgi:polysaccharide export outer membrane protein